MLIPALILVWLLLCLVGVVWVHGAEIGRHNQKAFEAEMVEYYRERKAQQYLSEE